MKKIFTCIAVLLSAGYSFGQSFEFTHIENTPWGGSGLSSVITGRAYIKNTSANTIDVKVKRIMISEISGSRNYFCWDVCYPPTTGISNNSLTIAPGDTAQNFYADYEPQGNAGVSTITYCFYDKNNLSDSACVTVHFNATATGIETLTYADQNRISQAYPNPALTTTKINYALRNDAGAAQLELHNMLGAKIKTVDLKDKIATVEIPVSELQAGIYFYSLVVDGKTISTKKLVVQ